MNRIITRFEVFTLEEGAKFLRISVPEMRQLANQGQIPGKLIGRKWRFLKSAIEEWLRKPDSHQSIMQMAGIFKDDETLPEIVKEAYWRRRAL